MTTKDSIAVFIGTVLTIPISAFLGGLILMLIWNNILVPWLNQWVSSSLSIPTMSYWVAWAICCLKGFLFSSGTSRMIREAAIDNRIKKSLTNN